MSATRIGSLEVHYALLAARLTRLPVRAIVGQWVRELGIRNGLAVFPGPRRSPGNVTSAHVGRVCGFLWGGSATEQHKFPVFCTTTDGVKEYSWWFNNIHFYTSIARLAAGNWRTACNLIERSPWTTGHYGGTLDVTAGACVIRVVKSSSAIANLRIGPGRAHAPIGQVPLNTVLALVDAVRGEVIAGNAVWYQVRYGPGDGRLVFIHSSVARGTTV